MRLRHHEDRAERSAGSSRGVALVEFAFISMILLVLVAGAIDYGLAWRSAVVATEAGRAGARTGAAMAVSPRADYEALSGVRASLAAGGRLDDVDRVVLFRATSANGAPPASCIAQTPSGSECVVLNQAQLDNISPSNFNYTLAADPWLPATGTGCMTSNRMLATTTWCPSSRNNTLHNAQYLGIYIRLKTDNLFPILGAQQTIERTAVMRLEPTPL
jgi:Flp pilus assembly protein TadG